MGIVLVATGAAFAIGAGVSLFVRNDLIDTIKSDCPGTTSPLVCPASMYNDVENMRSTANMLAPLAAILGGVGVAALATGVVLIALGAEKHVVVAPSGLGLSVRGAF